MEMDFTDPWLRISSLKRVQVEAQTPSKSITMLEGGKGWMKLVRLP